MPRRDVSSADAPAGSRRSLRVSTRRRKRIGAVAVMCCRPGQTPIRDPMPRCCGYSEQLPTDSVQTSGAGCDR